jgi:hypothetical protein
MTISNTLKIALCAAALGAPGISTAAIVYGQPADLTGTRSNASGGLVGSGGYNFAADPDNLVELAWNIVFANNTWNYEYTFSGTGLGIGPNESSISHLTLDLSDDCISLPDPNCVTNANGGPLEFGDIDNIVGAVKFDFGGVVDAQAGEVVYSFTSNRSPVWGNLCVKNGGGEQDACPAPDLTGSAYLWNRDFADLTSEDTIGFIARPNGDTTPDVPTPAPLALIALGAIALAWRRRAAAKD